MSKKTILSLLIVAFLALILFVARVGFEWDYVDTVHYVALMHFFSNDNDLNVDTARLLKPAYGWFGFLPKLFLGDYAILTLMNWSFFVALLFVFFFVLKKLNYSNKLCFVGVLWLAFSYPMLKYGLALGTDVAGWFFSAFTILLILHYAQNKNNLYLFLVSTTAAIGILTKETGGLAISFSVIYLFFAMRGYGIRFILKKLAILIIPFLVIFGLWQLYVYLKFNYSYLDWIFRAESSYGENYRTFKYFLFTELSSFGLLWLYFFNTLFKNREHLRIVYVISILPLFLSVLMWPVFISRILFIQFLLIIPVSLSIFEKYNFKRTARFILYGLPVLSSVVLFLISGKDSLFDVLNKFL